MRLRQPGSSRPRFRKMPISSFSIRATSREKAAEKVYSELGRIRLVREARRKRGGDCTGAAQTC